jgi:predicted lipid-binding transport protein (Tim44 family)
MRLVPALLSILLTAAPALAQIGEPGDSAQQTSAYGTFFAYILGAVGSLVVILLIVHQIRTMRDEARRGKKTGKELVEILDDEKPKKKKRKDLYLGEKVPEWKAGNRKAATWAGLNFLARADEAFDPKRLAKVATEAFRSVKAAVEARTTKAIERRVTPTCLDKLKGEIKNLRQEGERHVFGRLEVTEVDVVHVEAPADEDRHTFTALIGARSQDYIADEQTGKPLRGDRETYAYQEFWQFRRVRGKWLVERIRSSGDMDRVLNAKNLLPKADLDRFAKKATPEHLREFGASDVEAI